MRCLRASIFEGFWWIWAVVLGGKNKLKWNQNRSPKTYKILWVSWRRLELIWSVKEASRGEGGLEGIPCRGFWGGPFNPC